MRRAGTMLAALAGVVLVVALFGRLTTSSEREGRLGVETPSPTGTSRPDETRPALDVLPTPPAAMPWWLAVSTDQQLRLIPLSGGATEVHRLSGGAHSDASPRLLPLGESIVTYTNDGVWTFDLTVTPARGRRIADAARLLPGGDGTEAWLTRRDGEFDQVYLLRADGMVAREGTATFSPEFGMAPDRLVGTVDGGRTEMVMVGGVWDTWDNTSRGGRPVAARGERLAWCAFRCRDLLVQDLPKGEELDPYAGDPLPTNEPVTRFRAPEAMRFGDKGVFDTAGARIALPLVDAWDPSRLGVAVADVVTGEVTVVLPPAREPRHPLHLAWTPDDRDLVVSRRDSLVFWRHDEGRLYRVPLPISIEPWNGFAIVAR